MNRKSFVIPYATGVSSAVRPGRFSWNTHAILTYLGAQGFLEKELRNTVHVTSLEAFLHDIPSGRIQNAAVAAYRSTEYCSGLMSSRPDANS